jgi:chitodextrinase
LTVLAITAVLLILSSEAANAAVGFVQGAYATPKNDKSSVSITFPKAQAAGDLNVVVVGWDDTTTVVSSVTDSRGNQYTLAVGPTRLSGQLSQSIYYSRGILPSAAGTNIVTVRFTARANVDIRILEYSGLDTVNPLDVTAAASGNSAVADSGPATTTNANDLIFGANTALASTTGPGTGFASRIITKPDGNIAEDEMVSTSGSYRATAPLTASRPWIMQMVAFKAVSGGGGDLTPPTNPSNLLATAAGTGAISLTWSASMDNVGVTNYLIERCQGLGCTNFVQIGTISSTTYSDTGLLSATSYSYRVKATDAAGNVSGYSNVSTATTDHSTAGSILFVQMAYATPQSAQSSIPVTFASAQTAGNLNVIVIGWKDTTAAVSSVTDSTGNVYALAVAPKANPGFVTQSIYFAKNIAGASANTNTVTVRFNVAAQYPDIRILEYSGLDQVNPIDVTAAAIGNSTAANSGVATTTNANDLIFGANTVSTGNASVGAGFTSRVITSPDDNLAEDMVVSAVGSYSANSSLTSSGPWVMQMVSFRRAGGGAPPPPPSQVGQWSGPYNWPIVAVHMALLSTGKVLAHDGWDLGNDARIWDPSTSSFSAVPTIDNIFCSGGASLPDGRHFVAGGNGAAHVGLSTTNLFDPVSQTWSSGPPMAYPRWYPTVTTLPDGRMLVTLGETSCNYCEATIPEIYDPKTNSFTQLPNAILDYPYYPHIFTLPDGRVLLSSTSEAPVEPWVLNLQTQTWTVADDGGPIVDGGSAVMYRPGKILKVGSASDPSQPTRPSTATAYVLDMTQGGRPPIVQIPSMNFARTYHTMLLLPDGNVLVTGGGQTTDAVGVNNAVHEAEMWSAVTQTFTKMASAVAPRLYHSTALLLPDARVLVAGGGRFQTINEPTDQLSAEIYSPPYLFNGPRPTISSAPSTISYGTNFAVATSDAPSIASVALMRLGSVTHAFDMNQRYVPLTFQQGSGGLTVQSPNSANLAPPGHYMLFIINSSGVPSVAPIIKIQ